MSELDDAILRTVLYGDVFHFAMSPREIHHFLISDQSTTLHEVEQALQRSRRLAELLVQRDGLVAWVGRADLIELRAAREAASAHLLPQARRYGRWLACLPFVRMVAITGALAMRNASDIRDDLDYVLVTAPGRVWLARAFAIVIVRLSRRRGALVCPNYVLAETALAQDRRNLYIAHEVAQMVPLYGFALYARMRDQNVWAADYLPNADAPFYPEVECRLSRPARAVQRVTEWLLGGRLGDALEGWESTRKLRRFRAQMDAAHEAARLDSERVKGHFQDHGQRVLDQYMLRLREHGLTALQAAAD